MPCQLLRYWLYSPTRRETTYGGNPKDSRNRLQDICAAWRDKCIVKPKNWQIGRPRACSNGTSAAFVDRGSDRNPARRFGHRPLPVVGRPRVSTHSRVDLGTNAIRA